MDIKTEIVTESETESVSVPDTQSSPTTTTIAIDGSPSLPPPEIKIEEETGDDLSHQDVMGIVRASLREVLQDPLLCDLPTDVTAEEINLQVALEHGQAMTVNIRKQNNEVLCK